MNDKYLKEQNINKHELLQRVEKNKIKTIIEAALIPYII